jgi:8-oxo-dGTP diphosphatase
VPLGEEVTVTDAGEPPRETHVVTCFLMRPAGERVEVFLVRRSERVRTYRGAWAGISGYLEPGVTPLEQAYTELREEVGLGREDVRLLRAGPLLPVRDEEQGLAWVVHPFAFALAPGATLRTDWEAVEHAWVAPEALATLATVPKLAEALAAVWKPGMPL